MLVRPYKVSDVRDYFIGAKQGGGYGQTIDKTGVRCLELIGASFLADEPAIFGTPNVEYIQAEINWYLSQSLNIEDIYGKVPGFTNIGNAPMGGVSMIPFSQYGPNLLQRAGGGEINNLRQGGFPRKNGKIAGPGTETSDDIPAMLSDGEFVINSRTVRGLGAAMGGKGKQDTRDRGSKFLYSLQDKYGGKK